MEKLEGALKVLIDPEAMRFQREAAVKDITAAFKALAERVQVLEDAIAWEKTRKEMTS